MNNNNSNNINNNMNKSTSNDNNNNNNCTKSSVNNNNKYINWKHHQVELAVGQAIQVHTFSHSQQSKTTLTSTNKPYTPEAFCDDIHNTKPFKMQYTFPITNLWEESIGTFLYNWERTCDTISTDCSNLTTLGIKASNNNQGKYPFVYKFITSVNNFNNLKTFEIADNMINYHNNGTLHSIVQNMSNIETLSLRHTSSDDILSTKFCIELANTIRDLTNLRNFYFCNAKIESKYGFDCIIHALKNKILLEKVQLYGITVVPLEEEEEDSAIIDLSDDALQEPIFIENQVCIEYLTGNGANDDCTTTPYTMAERLDALLHVRKQRQHCQESISDDDNNTCNEIGLISDRLDTIYEYMRNRIDPAIWSSM